MIPIFEKRWFFENGLIKLKEDEQHPNENSILYTIVYSFLYKHLKHGEVLNYVLPNGQIAGPRSWDNMTGILTYIAHHDSNTVTRIKIWPNYLHPRDIIYIGYVQERFWAYPLLPFLFIMLWWSAFTHYKVRPTLWHWALNGFKEKRYKILKTDSEQLYWIRLHLPERYKFMHWTAKVIVPMLQKRFGDNYFNGICRLRYVPTHPIRLYYEGGKENRDKLFKELSDNYGKK